MSDDDGRATDQGKSSRATAAELIHKLSPEKQALLAQRLREKRAPNRVTLHAEQDMVTGPVPVIPMLVIDYVHQPPQAWWRAFEMLVEVPRLLRPAQLMEAMQHLIVHHDGLRLRLVKENMDYRMFIAASEQGAFEERDLSHLSAPEQNIEIETAKEAQWASLSFSTGPLFRMVFFELGLQRLPRMLIVLHHFAVDAYSVGVLLNDFETACRQLVMGEALKLPAKTTSIKAWAERMDAYLHSDSAKSEVAYWKSLPWGRVRPTPVDHPEVSQSPYASLTGFLDKNETQALLFKVPAAYQVRLWDVLITACFLTYARYAKLQPLFIQLLHHGRNLTFDGLDLFRTVGNLYTSHPLLLDIDLDASLENPEKVLKLVAEERMRVPHGGAAWHSISYSSTEEFISLHENMKITPNVVFNYLGEIKAGAQTQSNMFREIQNPADKAAMHLYDVTGKSPHTCETIIEAGRFKVNWEYFSACDDEVTIERLIREYLTILRTLIRTAG